MKKIIILISLVFILTGCTDLNNETIEDIIDKKIKTNYTNKTYNTYNRGYKYYLPKKMTVNMINDTNEVIHSGKHSYYLYLDLVSVLEENQPQYEIEENLYKSLEFNHNKINGYLKIKQINEHYLVEIMYNYAKIEVIVEKYNLKSAINKAITILSTVNYNKDIIKNLIDDNLLNYKDETLKLFDKITTEDNFIKYEEQYNDYNAELPDYDVIK